MLSILTLVVNLSLRSIRLIIFNDSGEKVYEDWLPVRTYINNLTIEQDPNEWWELLQELLKKVFNNKKLSTRVRYITVTSSALCLVIFDKDGNVLDKSYMVSDKRAEQESKLLAGRFSDFFQRYKSFKIDPSYMLPKVFWFKKHKQKVFHKAKKFLSANDFLIYKLTNKFVTDNLNAEKFYFEPGKKNYPQQILRFIGISANNLPGVARPGTVLGEMEDKLKKQLGISHSVKVILSTYDAICALVGSSTYEEGELNNVCGTCSSYRLFSKTNTLSPSNKLITQNFPGEKLSIIGGSNNLEGGALEWFKESFYSDFLKDEIFLYSLMEKEAQESELGANGLMFLPHLLGERVPFFDSDVRGMFFGVERFHSRKDFARSIFEAMGFQAKMMLEEFEKNGFKISSINFSGGVAKIPFAAKLRADFLGLPVNVLAEVETTAFGAFIFTLKARKVIKSVKEASGMIKIRISYIPNMHHHNCYASLFIIYKELYNANKDIFKLKKEVDREIMHYKKRALENL